MELDALTETVPEGVPLTIGDWLCDTELQRDTVPVRVGLRLCVTLFVRVPDRVTVGLLVRVTVTVPLGVAGKESDAAVVGEKEWVALPEALMETLPVPVWLVLGETLKVEAKVGGCVLVPEWLGEGLRVELRVPDKVPEAQWLEVGELLVQALLERVRVTELVTVSLRELEAPPEVEGVREAMLEAELHPLGLRLCVTDMLCVGEGVKEDDMVRDRVGDVEAQKEGVWLSVSVFDLVMVMLSVEEGRGEGVEDSVALRDTVALEVKLPLPELDSEPVLQAVKLTVPVRDAVALGEGVCEEEKQEEAVKEGVAHVVGDCVCEGVCEMDCEVLTVPVPTWEAEKDCVTLVVLVGLPLYVGLAVVDAEMEGVAHVVGDWVCEGVWEMDCEALTVPVGAWEEDRECVPDRDCDGLALKDGLAVTDAVKDAVAQGLGDWLSVGVRDMDCEALTVPVPAWEAEKDCVALSVPVPACEAEKDCVRLTVLVPACEAEKVCVMLRVALPRGDTLGVCEPDPDPDWHALTGGLSVLRAVLVAVGQKEAVAQPEAVMEVLRVALGVFDPVGLALGAGLEVLHSVLLPDLELLTVLLRDCVSDTVAHAVEVTLGVAEGEGLLLPVPQVLAEALAHCDTLDVSVGEAVVLALALRHCVALPVPERKEVGEGECVALPAALVEGETVRDSVEEGRGLGVLVPQAVAQALLLAVPVPHRVALEEKLGEAVPLTVPVGRGLALAVGLPVPLPQAEGERLPLLLLDTVEVTVGDCVPLGVSVVDWEALAVAVPVLLGAREELPVLHCEAVPEGGCVCVPVLLCVTVAQAEAVVLPLPLTLTVEVGEWDAESEGVIVGVGEVDCDPECVGVTVSVEDTLCVCVTVMVTERVKVPVAHCEAVPLTVAVVHWLGVCVCEGVCVGEWVGVPVRHWEEVEVREGVLLPQPVAV